MISQKISECLSDRTGSYLIPLLWYTGESAEQVRKEMDAIRRAGISEFIFENRGGAFLLNVQTGGHQADCFVAIKVEKIKRRLH